MLEKLKLDLTPEEIGRVAEAVENTINYIEPKISLSKDATTRKMLSEILEKYKQLSKKIEDAYERAEEL